MTSRIASRISRFAWAVLLAVLFSGCTGPSKSHKVAGRASAGGPALEGFARRSRSTVNKVRQYLAASEAYLGEGSPASAIRCAHEARRTTSSTQLRAQADFLLGKAHLGQLKLALAERYLEKSIAGLKTPQQEASIAHLIVCLKMLNKTSEAAAVMARLKAPGDPRIQAILNAPRPRMVEKNPPKAPAIAGIGSLPPIPSTTGGRQLPHLQVIPRSNWKARSTIKSRATPMSRIFRMTVHHSGEPGGISTISKWGSAREILRIQRYHQSERAWADIGYHYVVDRDGRVWQGRPVSYQGAHAKGDANRGNIGIVVLGNYSYRKQTLTIKQRDSLKLLVLKLGQYFSIPPGRLYTHGEILPGHTTCPGPHLTAYTRTLRTELKRHQATSRSPQELTSATGSSRGK